MKHTKQKLLSLLMVFAMVLSLAPTAWAEDEQQSLMLSDSSVELQLGNGGTNAKTITVTGPENVKNKTVTWTSDNTDIATVENGTITAVAAGETTVTATVTVTEEGGEEGGGEEEGEEEGAQSRSTKTVTYKGTCMVTVKAADVPVTNIRITTENLTVEAGKTLQLAATVSPENATNKEITWSSDAPSVARVTDEGVVTGVSEGRATITATAKDGSNVTTTCTVTVTEADTYSMTLDPSSYTYRVNTDSDSNKTFTITPTIKKNDEVIGANEGVVTYSSSDEEVAEVDRAGKVTLTGKIGTATITVKYILGSETVVTKTCTVTVTNDYTGTLTHQSGYPASGTSVTLYDYYYNYNYDYDRYDRQTFAVVPSLKAGTTTLLSSEYTVEYTWTLNSKTLNSSDSSKTSCTVYYSDLAYSGSTGNKLTCTAVFRVNGVKVDDATCTWTIYRDYTTSVRTFSATVYDGNPGYSLTEKDDANGTSIADQIDSWVRNNYDYYGSSYYRNYQVYFPNRGTHYETTTSSSHGYLEATSGAYDPGDLGKVLFTPGSTVSTSTGSYKISYDFTIRVYRSSSSYDYQDVNCTMTFTVKQGTVSSGNINYAAPKGTDVEFELSDFRSFWTDYQSKGSLSYITIDSISNGKLYTKDGKSVTKGDQLYVSPSSSQRALDGLYFTPTSSSTSSGKVTFTARGSSSGSGSSYTRGGTVSISFLSNAASTIKYSTNSNNLAGLDYNDFIDAYKEATGSKTTPSNLTIEFQSVPAYGTLSYVSGSSTTKLTSSNISSKKFNAKSSGSNRINDVVYTGSGSRTETISYIGYIGGTASFTGEITFNSVPSTPTTASVSLVCYSAQGITLNPQDFITAGGGAFASASYVMFGKPVTGSLTGLTNNIALIQMLGSVKYVPSSSVSRTTDEFTFTVYNANSVALGSGKVTVTVSLTDTTVNAPVVGAVTSISQLTDVPAGAWYATQLSSIIAKGMIKGTGNGKFNPTGTMTYGEALKMIMNSAGYVREEPQGAAWADNYKATAVAQGWIDASQSMTAVISRLDVAKLTAKILNIPASSNANIFVDVTDAYASALYQNNIMIGVGTDPATGRPIFQNYAGESLNRASMIMIVYNMYEYTGR